MYLMEEIKKWMMSVGIESASHVLLAINLPTNLIEGALRISIGKFTTDAELVYFQELTQVVNLSPLCLHILNFFSPACQR
jgi:hypothetical protein